MTKNIRMLKNKIRFKDILKAKKASNLQLLGYQPNMPKNQKELFHPQYNVLQQEKNLLFSIVLSSNPK